MRKSHVASCRILTAATSDGVDVVRNGSLVHDGIHAGEAGLRATRHAPESVGATHEGEGGGGGAPHVDDGRRGLIGGVGEFRSRPMDCGVGDMDAVDECLSLAG